MKIDTKMLWGALIAILLSLSTWTLLNTHQSKIQIEIIQESLRDAEKNTNRLWGFVQEKL